MSQVVDLKWRIEVTLSQVSTLQSGRGAPLGDIWTTWGTRQNLALVPFAGNGLVDPQVLLSGRELLVLVPVIARICCPLSGTSEAPTLPRGRQYDALGGLWGLWGPWP